MLQQIKNTASFIRNKVDFKPQVGIILGSGLGGLTDNIQVVAQLDYKDIPGFPVSTVAGHAGRLIFGMLGGKRVVAMQGRFHYYEGYTPQQVVFPVRVLKMLGIEYLFVSNAGGGVNPDFHVGDVMVITDHINMIPNPLIGPNPEELGPRFPDMSEAYSRELIALADGIAEREGIALQHGCYWGGTGPTYETPAEYRFFHIAGADSVGMSTTPEVIAARHMGLPVFAVSVITNIGLSGLKSTHEEVQQEGRKAQQKMARLFIALLEAL